MRRSTLLLIVAVLSGCSLIRGPAPGATVALQVVGDGAPSERSLRDFARRELRAFDENGGRLADLADAAYAVQRGLRNEGFAHALVEAVPPRDDASASLEVDTGPEAFLDAVTLPGAVAVPAETLLRLFPAQRTELLRRGAPPLRMTQIGEGIADVERTYLLAGYGDVRVGPPEVEWDETRTRARVRIPIVEGPCTTVRSARVEGRVPAALRAAVAARLPSKGAPFHARVASETTAAVRRVLLDAGHAKAEVATRAERDASAATVDLVVTAQAGPAFRIADVLVEGEDRSRRGFVRERLGVTTGDLAARSDLDAAIDALYETGVFRSVDVRVLVPADLSESTGSAGSAGSAGSGRGDPVPADLRVRVEEADARSVELEIGWGSYELLRAGARYVDRNLSGTGRALEADVSVSLKSRGTGLALEDRHLLGPRNVLRAETKYFEREEPTFDDREATFQLSVRRALRRGLFVHGGYLFRAHEARRIKGVVPGIEQSGFERSAGPFLTVGRDTRDDPLFPTRGALGDVGAFLSAPSLGSELHYVEWRAAYHTYSELRPGTVLALGGRAVTRDVLDSDRTLPVQERLFSGGETTVRSFREDDLGPADGDGEPLGGLTSVDLHAELRQSLFGDLDGAVFYDVGVVARRTARIPRRRGQAWGVGLRYRLPVGPVRLDWGWNPGDRFAADRSWALHLSFGFAF